MLVPMIPVKTFAKMLLILMMGPSDKAPRPVTLAKAPVLSPEKSVDNKVTLTQLPNGYYQLQYAGNNKSIYFSQQQLTAVTSFMNSDERADIYPNGPDLSKLACYIVNHNLLHMGSDQLPRVYDNSSSASSEPRNTVVAGVSVTVNEPQNNNRKMYRDWEYTFSPDKINYSMQLGDVPALLKEQKNIDKGLKSWHLSKNTRAILTQGQFYVDRSLIDWGCLPLPLQQHRALQKYGKKKALEAQLQLTKDRLASRFWRWQYGERNLKLEEYYLEKVLKDPITNFLFVIRYGEGPEASTGFDDFKRQWAGLTPNQRAIIEKQLGFSPVRMADFLMDNRPKSQPIRPPLQPTQSTAAIPPATDLPATSAQTTANTPTVVSSTSPQPDITSTTQQAASPSETPIHPPTTTAATTTASTASSSTASAAQSYPTTDLPTAGANTSSAPSIITDDTSIGLNPEQNVALNQMILDMVTTGPSYLRISPEAQELVNSKLAELADKYQAGDPMLYLEALGNILKSIQEHNPSNVSIALLKALGTKGYIESRDVPLLYQCALHLTHGIVQTITDIPGLIHANKQLARAMLEGLACSGCDLHPMHDNYDKILGPDSVLLKIANVPPQALSKENVGLVFQHIALMSPQEKSKALGNIVGAYLQGKIIAGAIPIALKGVENITQVVAESRVGQSVAQSVEKLAQGATRIGTAEEVIAVTAEGIPVAISTAAEETVSLQNAAQKVGGAAQKTENLLVSVAEQAIIKNLTDSVAATVRQDIPRLRQLFDGKIKGFKECANKFLKFEYEHTLGIDLTWTRRGMPDISGFHHDMMGLVEKSGIFEFANKRMLSNGFYKAELFFKGHKVKEITFFPSNWSRDKVMSKIIEAYENVIKSGIELSLEPNQKYKLVGMIEEGIAIEMHITQQGKITSGYPIIK